MGKGKTRERNVEKALKEMWGKARQDRES